MMTEYKVVTLLDGSCMFVPYRVVDVPEFEYISIEQFISMTDLDRTKYLTDLHLYEMRFDDDWANV